MAKITLYYNSIFSLLYSLHNIRISRCSLKNQLHYTTVDEVNKSK